MSSRQASRGILGAAHGMALSWARRWSRLRRWFVLLTAPLMLLSSCSREADPVASLEELLARREYSAVVEQSERELVAAQRESRPRADCAAIERCRLQALACLGQVQPLIAEWRLAQARYGDLILPMEFGTSLAVALQRVDPTGASTQAFLAAMVAELQATIAARAKDVRPDAGPHVHPEGFPRAWLAPDERPHDP